MENFDIKKIINELKSVLPAKWQMTNMYIELNENAWEIFYYCIIEGISKPVQCYNIDTIEEEKLDSAFNNIQKYARASLEIKKTKIITLTLFNDNLYRINTDCPELPDGSYDYKKDWIIKNATFLNLDEVISNYNVYKDKLSRPSDQIIIFDDNTGAFSNHQQGGQELEFDLNAGCKTIALSYDEEMHKEFPNVQLLKNLYKPLSTM